MHRGRDRSVGVPIPKLAIDTFVAPAVRRRAGRHDPTRAHGIGCHFREYVTRSRSHRARDHTVVGDTAKGVTRTPAIELTRRSESTSMHRRGGDGREGEPSVDSDRLETARKVRVTQEIRAGLHRRRTGTELADAVVSPAICDAS